MASGWAAWAIAAAVLLSIVPLVRWGRRHSGGRAGGVALLLGLAFGHLFDPARAEATETLLKRRDTGEAHEAAPAAETP